MTTKIVITGKEGSVPATPFLTVNESSAPDGSGVLFFVGSDGSSEIQLGPNDGNVFLYGNAQSYDEIKADSLEIVAGTDIILIPNNAGNGGAVIPYGDSQASLGTPGFRFLDLYTSGKVSHSGLPVFVNNAAAIAGGLTAGNLYRTGADPDPVCIVH